MSAQLIKQVPAILHVQIVRGDAWALTVTVTGLDLTNRTITAAIKPARIPPSAAPEEVALSNTKTDPTGGEFRLNLSSATSADLPLGHHTWYVEIHPASGEERTYLGGRWIVEER